MVEKKDDSPFTFTVAWTIVLMIAAFIVLFCYSFGPLLFKKQYWHYGLNFSVSMYRVRLKDSVIVWALEK